MSFWIYENVPTNHATIHTGACGYCKFGKGTSRAPKGSTSSKWHGPYADLSHAEAAGNLLRRPLNQHSCTGAASSPRNSGYKRFEVEPADESTLRLDELFDRRMKQIYVTLRDETGYAATRFLTAVHRHGGVEHAKRSLRRSVSMQSGFEKLKSEGRLHQTMEAHVADPKFRTLFTPSEIAEAHRRLG